MIVALCGSNDGFMMAGLRDTEEGDNEKIKLMVIFGYGETDSE